MMTGASEDLARENAALRDELRALQARYDALETSTSEKIQALTDENEILADANQLLMENEEAFKRLNGGRLGSDGAASASVMQVPDELLLPGPGLKTQEVATVEEVHAFGNLLSVAAHSTRPELALTGGVDKSICLHDWQQRLKLCGFSAGAPVLSLVFNPRPELADYFVAGFMDATHGLYKLAVDGNGSWSIEEVARFHDHTRHGTLRAVWSATGLLFATGSSDKSLNMYRCSFDAAEADKMQCEKLKTFYFNGTVEAIAFAPRPGDSQTDGVETTETARAEVSELLAIAVRDDCYVHYVDCSTLEKERVNMNQDGIEHVSYTIMDLRLSPSGKYLLAATDSSRHFVFEVKSNVVLRSFYGHKAGPYSQPRALWHPSEKYVVSNTEDDGSIFVWSVASEQVVETIAAHDALVRDLAGSGNTSGLQTLLTVSYDKRLKIWHSSLA